MKPARDLTASSAAWLLWYLPIAVIILASAWIVGRDLVWAVAFAVMGMGCLANARRCHRLHCYFTSPLFLGAAAYAAAAQFHLVPIRAGLFLLLVFGLACALLCAEGWLGRYRRTPNDPRAAPRKARGGF